MPPTIPNADGTGSARRYRRRRARLPSSWARRNSPQRIEVGVVQLLADFSGLRHQRRIAFRHHRVELRPVSPRISPPRPETVPRQEIVVALVVEFVRDVLVL